MGKAGVRSQDRAFVSRNYWIDVSPRNYATLARDVIRFELIEKSRTCTRADSHKSVVRRVRIVDVGRVLSRTTGIAG